jgi:2-polyprenyl-3-methyl-5-hydroxy-6-metoxy-1,4-benzoquinol methylase
MDNKVRIWPTRHSLAKPDHLERYIFASNIIKSETTCIDAACGGGYGTSILHHANIKVVGIDISEDAINHALYFFQTSPDQNSYVQILWITQLNQIL